MLQAILPHINSINYGGIAVASESSNSVTMQGPANFSIVTQIKAYSMHYTESLKAKFTILNNNTPKNSEKVLYKISLLAPDKKQYLFTIGQKTLGYSVKLSTNIRFSKAIPPYPSFKIVIEIFQNHKRTAYFKTNTIEVTDEGAEKAIKFLGVETFSQIVIPENPLIFWLKFTGTPIPRPKKFEVQATLTQKNLVIDEESYEISLDGCDFPAQAVVKYPFQLNISDFAEPKESLKLTITVQDLQSSIQYYTKTLVLHSNMQLKGFRFTHVGYKRDIRVGEVAYMIGDLSNKTPLKVWGQAHFFFHTLYWGEFPCFSRKFSIRAQNFEKISEDITLTENLAGMPFWVVCRMKIKTRLGSVQLEGLSPLLETSLEESAYFNVIINTAVHGDGVFFNDVIPVGIDTRIHTHSRLKHVICSIFQNFENIEQKPLFSFRIKNLEADHRSFHWKVPSKYGTCYLTAGITVEGHPILPDNLNLTSVHFDLRPKPKKGNKSEEK